MPSPRETTRRRNCLDPDRLHQLATGFPRGLNSAGAWGLPWKWRDTDRAGILASMAATYAEHRAEVLAYAAELSPGREPFAARFDQHPAAACATATEN